MIVLCYHGVSAQWPSALAVTQETLERHVETLLHKGLAPRTFSAGVSDADPRTFAITFDDAYASVPEQALPVLSGLGVPGTVFAPTAHAGSGAIMSWPGIDDWLDTEWEDELRGATWEQLRELADGGWEVGSHSASHPRLTSLADEDLASELRESRLECERQLGIPCTSIAYPYGDTDERVVAASAAAGYSAGGALDGRVSSQPERMRWPRLGVYPPDGPLRFGLKIWSFTRPSVWNALQGARRAARRQPDG